jgi:translation initiation factor 1A
MPKNKGKGGKQFRKNKTGTTDEKRELVFREDGQAYAQVLRCLGGERLEVFCFDGQKRLCHMPRSLKRNRVIICQNDIILVSLRSYQDQKCDALHRYTSDESKQLKAFGELPETALLGDEEKQEIDVTFDAESQSDDVEATNADSGNESLSEE